jgi:uncharacterized protein YndB with AHSA1/START domain
MQTARMAITFDVPIELVWEVLTDYAGYARFPGVAAARVLKPGHEQPAGVGAIREVEQAGSVFIEEIVEFEPPRMLAYKIVSSRPIPIAHEIGRVRLTPRGGRTELEWETTAALDVPLIGSLFAYPMRLIIQRSFGHILRWLKQDLERAAQ